MRINDVGIPVIDVNNTPEKEKGIGSMSYHSIYDNPPSEERNITEYSD